MKFAFLVHSRDYTDVYRKYSWAEYIPKIIINIWCRYWPPIILSKINDYKPNISKKSISGIVIGIPMTAKQMLEHRSSARKKVLQAIRKAEKLGVQVVGLGALTSSITFGGKWLLGRTKSYVTPGHAFTGHIVSSYALEAMQKFFFSPDQVKVAIVGAAGAIGSTCAQILTMKGIKNFIFVDLERKLDRLNKLLPKLLNQENKLNIELTHNLQELKQADIIIAATNAPEAVIQPKDLKPGVIIVDDAQPSDISPEVAETRDDVIIIDGGVVSIENLNIKFDFGLASDNEIFSCLAESIIYASVENIPHYTVDSLSYNHIQKVIKAGEELGFGTSKWQRSGKIYSQEKINGIKKIILDR